MADPKISKRGRAEDNLSAPSSFIANAHNEIYAFYTKKRLSGKKYEPMGGGAPSKSATADQYF